MYFKKYHRLPSNTPPAYVEQVTLDELKSPIVIEHIGAVLDIKSEKKEDTLMVEKLKAYRAELEAEKAEVVNSHINVEPAVEEYRAKMIAEAEANKAAKIAKIESDISCIDAIIEREEAIAAAPATDEVTTVSLG